jgi:hypothetical protein
MVMIGFGGTHAQYLRLGVFLMEGYVSPRSTL